MMEIVDCHGPPSKRGIAHGETLRSDISDALARWEQATMAALKERAPHSFVDYCETFLNETDLIDRARNDTPNLYQELAGIAEGSDQPFALIAAYNLMDEQWWYDTRGTAPPPGCSLIALHHVKGFALMQNMDLPEHMDGAQVVLRLSGPDIPQTLVLSAAGLIGLTGANIAGVAVGVNTLLMLRHSIAGLPVAFALRNALAAENRAEAVDRLVTAQHASGQHYAIVSRSGISAVECSAAVNDILPVDQASVYLHTNHPFINQDFDDLAVARLENAGFNRSSHRRFDWLTKHQGQLSNLEDAKARFDDANAPICMRAHTHGGSATFATVLYEMTDTLRIKMRMARAGDYPWQVVDF